MTIKDQLNGFATVFESGKPMGAVHYGRRGISAVKDRHAEQVMRKAQESGEFVIVWIENEAERD